MDQRPLRPLKLPTAKVIADSICPEAPVPRRLTTLEVIMPRFILAEFNTHRVFSRNSASSRAIPVKTQLDRVKNDPFIPLELAANKAGMQAGEKLDTDIAELAVGHWLVACDDALAVAERLLVLGVHKQWTNRLLEPFMWHTVIVTATEWDGFWAQRLSPLAQPEMRLTAEAMKRAYDESRPAVITSQQCHLPYVTEDDRLVYRTDHINLVKLSVARCARVSYLTHDGRLDRDADLDLFKRLLEAKPPHWSPMEHVAYPATVVDLAEPEVAARQRNFRGWIQLRGEVEDLGGLATQVYPESSDDRT